jgi:hypothetical protein
MKCPKCSRESTKKERQGGQCPKCRWTFRFDPPEPLSDYELEHAIQTVSGDGAFRYTRSQLIAEVERVLVKRATRIYETEAKTVLASDQSYAVWWFVGALVAIGLLCLFVFQELCGTPLLIMAVGVAVFRLLRRDAQTVASELRAQIPTYDLRAITLTDRYLLGQNLTLLVDAPTPIPAALGLSREAGPAAHRREFDLEAYGFDRVIVVQGDDLVDMLVKNQFHFQHNAAIVSFGGYPRHVAELVDREIAREGNTATVFLLHDASAEGRRLVEGWRSKVTLVKQTYDVGLTEAHASRLLPRRPALTTATSAEPVPDGALRVDLATLRPKQLMTLLFNAMAGADRAGTDAFVAEGAAADGDVSSFETVVETSFDFG